MRVAMWLPWQLRRDRNAGNCCVCKKSMQKTVTADFLAPKQNHTYLYSFYRESAV